MLLLGVLAAQAEGAVAAAGSYDLLETEILTGSQASVTFSSLNSTYGADYQHLQIRITDRSDRADAETELRLQFNSDTGSNYARHLLAGYGSGSPFSVGEASVTALRISQTPAASGTTNVFSASVVDILDPFETTKYTTIRGIYGMLSTASRLGLNSGLWMNTNAIDSIKLFPDPGPNLVSGTRISLYGLKASA